MKVCCLIRDQPWYRRAAFIDGLRAAGHKVFSSPPIAFDREWALLIWNRYGELHNLALKAEAAGAVVLVAENGYLGANGTSPKFDVASGVRPEHYYAIARGYHNGGGQWHVGEEDRFSRLAVQLKPWREDGDTILVCPNRSFGVPERMMPPDWPERTAAKLKKMTAKRIVIRQHPGNKAPQVPLQQALASAFAAVVWYSTAGIHALADGVPVVAESPHWICRDAAVQTLDRIDEARNDAKRLIAMQKMAWSQWTCSEIENGLPFHYLLPAA